jgi:ribonuclease D
LLIFSGKSHLQRPEKISKHSHISKNDPENTPRLLAPGESTIDAKFMEFEFSDPEVEAGYERLTGTPTPLVEAPPYVYVTTDDQLSEVVADIQQDGPVALDVETFYENAKLTKDGRRMKTAIDTVCDRYKSKIRLLQLYRAGSGTVWLLDVRALDTKSSLFIELLGSLSEKRIVGHDLCRFDLPWLWTHLQFRASEIRDTANAQRLLSAGTNEPADLGSVFKAMIGLELPKDQGSSDWGTDSLTEVQLVYAAHDVRHLHDVLKAQEEAISEAGLETAWRLENKLVLLC